MEASAYPTFVFKTLENPALIWAKAYRSLSMRCQNLLVALYFGNQYRQPIKVLHENFNAIHNDICEQYSQPSIQQRTTEQQQEREREAAKVERERLEREKLEREQERDIGLGFSR